MRSPDQLIDTREPGIELAVVNGTGLITQGATFVGVELIHAAIHAEGFFLIFTSDSVRESNQIRLPFGEGKTSPVAVEDVARVVAAALQSATAHRQDLSPDR